MTKLDNNNNQRQPQVQNQKQDLYIEVSEPEKFRGILKSDVTTTEKLGKKINKLFDTVFSDYQGCSIMPDNFTGMLQINLFFRENLNPDPDKYKAFNQAGTIVDRSTPLIQKINIINKRNTNKKYEISEEAKQLLTEFYSIRGGKAPDWRQVVLEECEPANMGTVIYNKVIGMDLNKIVRKLFGGKEMHAGNKCDRIDYQVTCMKPLINPGMANMAPVNLNYQISIQQLNSSLVNELANEVGIIPSVGKIPMIIGQ